MQRSGGGAVFGEINVNSRRPLIPDVIQQDFADMRFAPCPFARVFSGLKIQERESN
jgi:hypothetical protein